MYMSPVVINTKTADADAITLALESQRSLQIAPEHPPVFSSWLGDEAQDEEVLVWDRTYAEMSNTFVDDWGD